MINKGVKSLVVLTYELLTTHVSRFTRWASTKAYLILNCLEVPFWFVVVILTFMGVSRLCQGVSCGLSIVVAFLAMMLVFVLPRFQPPPHLLALAVSGAISDILTGCSRSGSR